ncbi:hypothetical protein KRR39_14520 [Nocardioides panacis]|uniref:Choice-of-anchor G family protein n=1 Tax=Nocardioides panacis TaxID=2849501 RepID=A0A975SWH7_9ACTN|nr:hypothetical protein [Nocardioides panacis]QWZ06750.1 hypothetical protein KRR39_14520 [Nocardioides panacis]
MRSRLARVGAAALTTALVGLVAAPASAATVVARASATGVVLTAGGQPAGSGTYEVTHDGTRQTSTGSNRPAVSALTGQSLVSAGVLAQDATTRLEGRAGRSAACAGLAGDGATVAAVGDGDCLSPGSNLSLSAGSLDLSGLRIVDSTVLAGLDQQVQDALEPALAPVVSALQNGLQTGLGQLGNPGVFLDLGAVQSSCQAGPGTAAADASLAGVAAYAQVAGRRVDLLSLPVHPAPNTHVATDLGAVATAVEDALRSQLGTALDGSLGPLGAAVDRAAVLDNVLANISSQLGPLQENLVSGTLNKQSRPSADAVDVTALDLDVLPAAAQFGMQALSLQVGRSTCGPGGQIAPAVVEQQPAPPRAVPRARVLPTRVTAGLAGDDSSFDRGQLLLAVGALLTVAVGAGALDLRRQLRRER